MKKSICCLFCHTEHTVEVNDVAYARFTSGELFAQDAFPELAPDERELLISGICPTCWNNMFPWDEEDEEENPSWQTTDVNVEYNVAMDEQPISYEEKVWNVATEMWLLSLRSTDKLTPSQVESVQKFYPEVKLADIDKLLEEKYDEWMDEYLDMEPYAQDDPTLTDYADIDLPF